MRLLNGLFAFATILAIAALWAMPADGRDPISFFIWILIVWHGIWLLATRPGVDFPLRWAQTLIAGIFGTMAAVMFGRLVWFNATSDTIPMLCILALAELVYCLRVIAKSMPSSLTIRIGRKTLSPSPGPASLPASSKSAIALPDKQDLDK